MLEKNLLQILNESKYTVALLGQGMVQESGYPVFRDGDTPYEVEEKYGYSVEEIYSSAFYSTRKELFYQFYRGELLSKIDMPPGLGYDCLAKLQKEGMIDSFITRRIFGLAERAGCKNVFNLHGSIYDNFCPHCGKKYPIEFVLNSKKNVPLCTECNMAVRPNVTLLGEMVDNGLMTKATEEVSKAEAILVLGTSLNTSLCNRLIQYYEGDKLILVNQNEHFSDKAANIVIHDRVDETLKKLIEK